MKDVKTLLRFSKYTYKLTDKQGVYKLTDAPEITELPPLIRIEENQRKGKVQTPLIIRGKFSNWSKTILTGLLKQPLANVFSGDNFKKGKKSFMLFQFSPDRSKLKVLYFRNFMPVFPRQRTQIAKDYANRF